MKKLIFIFAIGTLVSLINLNCKNNRLSADESFQPIQSTSFAIHDSTYFFYEDYCKKLVAINKKKNELIVLNRGFEFNVKIEKNQLLFENKNKDEYHWWISGEGVLLKNAVDIRYRVSTPQNRTA